jgi:hypothetical protein
MYFCLSCNFFHLFKVLWKFMALYKSSGIFVLTLCFKLILSFFQTFPLLVPECPLLVPRLMLLMLSPSIWLGFCNIAI